jgi:TrmH family RNA methyltransferase
MLSKNQRKQIVQLSQKKYRHSSGLFVAEGEKVVRELIDSEWNFDYLCTTVDHFHPQAELIPLEEMKKITHFKSPSPVLGLFRIPKETQFVGNHTTIAVEGIKDPGNLGTLIRLCDWFGLNELVCSESTVDCFNPKVIQASMGSIARVRCHYVNDLADTLLNLRKPLYGAAVGGKSIYENSLPQKATYLFGSESHGISNGMKEKLDGQYAIPHFKNENKRAESLNVALAGAIFLSEIFRS